MVDKSGLERFDPKYFRVQVTGILEATAPADGGVDPKTPEEYGAGGNFPTSTALSLAKERGNMRWEAILRQAAERIDPIFIMNVVTNANQDTAGTDIEFTLVYDKPEYLTTPDESTPGTILNGDPLRETVSGNATNVITRYVARALVADVIQNREIFDPDTPDEGNTDQFIQVTAEGPEIDIASAEAKITVTEIAGTSPAFPTFT